MRKVTTILMTAMMVMMMGVATAKPVPLKLQPADIHEAAASASCTIVVNVTVLGYITESYGNNAGVTYKFSYSDWGKVSARTRGYIYTMVKHHCASR